MPILVPNWGQRGCALLPASLRSLWATHPIPQWVAQELGLSDGAKLDSLDATVWAHTDRPEAPESVRQFLISLVRLNRRSLEHLRALSRPWPPSLEPGQLPWSTRTRTCLENAGLLSDIPRLSVITFEQLFSIRAMGAASILDFACLAEAAFDPTANASSQRDAVRAEEDLNVSLLEAIDAPWALQVSSQDPRFSELLPSGNQTVFERLEQLTAEPEDPPLAEIELSRAIEPIKQRLSVVERMPLEVALADFIRRVARTRDLRLTAILRRLGCDGQPPATLEEAASCLGVTRERMRQLQNKFLERLPTHAVFMPQLDAAIAVVRESAPLTVDAASKLIQETGISTRPFHPKSLLSAADFCRRSETFEIDNSISVPRVVVEQRREIERLTLSIACRQAEASGATNIQEVLAELVSRKKPGANEENVRRLLKECREIEFLSDDWFWYTTGIPDRNRLRNLTRKMLSVTSPIHVGELRDGAHRYYKIRRTRGLGSWSLLTPPRAVLQDFYRRHPEFSIDSRGLVASVGQLDYRSELNPTERVLFDVLRSSPASLLDRSSFAKSCADLGMNPNTFSQYLTGSPVIAHIGPDIWSLRGTRVDPAAVEALREANAARPLEKRIIDHGWSQDGELWLAARLPEHVSHFVLGIPSAIRRFVVGKEFSASDENGLTAGTVRVNAEGTSYGYAPFLTRRGADADDILLISFRVSGRSATLRLLDDEELEALSPGA